MQFRTKDLLITALPEGAEQGVEMHTGCYAGSQLCLYPTCCRFATCGQWVSICRFCSNRPTCVWQSCPNLSEFEVCRPVTPLGCDGTRYDVDCAAGSRWVVRDPSDIEYVRKEVTEVLKGLEEMEVVMQKPRTAKEAAAMEAHLEAALEEIRAHRKGLSKKR